MSQKLGFWARVLHLGMAAWVQSLVLLVAIVVLSTARLSTSHAARHLFDDVIPNKDLGRLHAWIAIMAAGAVVCSGAAWAKKSFAAQVAARVSHHVQRKMYERLQTVSIRFFLHTAYSEVRD